MNYNLWYAVQYEDDDDWGTGSYNREEAEKLFYSNDDYKRLVTIRIPKDDAGNEFENLAECVEEEHK